MTGKTLSLNEINDISGDYMQVPQEVYDLLDALIEKHSSLEFLRRYLPIKLLFRTKPKLKDGRKILGSTSVAKTKDRLIHPYSAVIVLDRDFWRGWPDKREPLLYHELCHLEEHEDETRLILRPHDIEEFLSVIHHYGDWQREIRQVVEQLSVFEQTKLENQVQRVLTLMDKEGDGDSKPS